MIILVCARAQIVLENQEPGKNGKWLEVKVEKNRVLLEEEFRVQIFKNGTTVSFKNQVIFQKQEFNCWTKLQVTDY